MPDVLLDEWEGGRVNRPASSLAAQDVVPTTLLPCDSFSASAINRVWLDAVLPPWYRTNAQLVLEFEWGSASTSANAECRWNCPSQKVETGSALNSISVGTDDSAEPTDSTTAYGRNVTQIVLANQPGSLDAGDRLRIEPERDPTAANDDLASPALVLWWRLLMRL